MGKLLKMEEAAQYLNVSQDCLRKWDKANKLKPLKTAGGHRRYSTDVLDEFLGVKEKPKEDTPIVCATYARVSFNEQKQKGDLDRQSQRLSEYCAKKGWRVTHIIKDVGSGLNDNRIGFIRLTDMILNKKVNRLVVEHKDRLTRFQFNFIKKMFEYCGCEVVVIDGIDVSNEEEFATDIMSLMASFSGKFYGKRSAERRKHKLKDKNDMHSNNQIFIVSEALNNKFFYSKEKEMTIPFEEVTDNMRTTENGVATLNDEFWNMAKDKLEKEIREKIELARGCYYMLNTDN